MKRTQYTPEEKVKILRGHLEDNISISDLAEKYSIHPTQIHKWKKSLFEGALDTFSSKHKKIKENIVMNKLKQKLLKKDEVISILSEEMIELKKNINGEI